MGEIGMAAMRANHVGAVLQIDASDGAWVGGQALGPKYPLCVDPVGLPDPHGRNAMTGRFS